MTDGSSGSIAGTLAGKTIVVTRPAHQAEPIIKLISESGGSPLRFPVLEINEPNNPLASNQLQAILSSAKLVIFISPNAVDYGMKMIQKVGGIPDAVKIAAVGQGSAKKLSQCGRPADVFPTDQYDSEALLAMDELQSMSGKNVVIFRGDGGRELLADTLRKRGANVDYIECYQRIRPDTDPAELSAALAANKVDAAVVTSNQGLQNLHDMLDPGDRSLLQKVQLFVVSDRGRRLAVELGYSQPAIIVNKVSDQGILDSLLDWSSN